jgi:hypothetical protein
MAVNRTSKQLHKHSLPIVVIVLALLVLSAAVFSRFRTGNLTAADAVAAGLVTHVVHVQPTTDGLAQVTLGDPANNSQPAGASLAGSLTRAGRTAQLSLTL